ncbi:MAG: alanine/glycine:cation symporter family protein [Lachnospiraceae bacterium]
MDSVFQTIHFMVWGPWTLLIFIGTGIWFTIRSGFFQIRGIRTWIGETAGEVIRADPDKEKENRRAGVTPFQSACTALAATIGTGNIVGVATALTAGGPGALFWMWLSALIGMMTAYAETTLGQKYRYRRSDGSWICGPMIYMERGLHCPAMGIIYAFLALFSSLGMGSMVQSNSISGTLTFGTGIPGWGVGVFVTAVVAAVIMGGAMRIARFSERIMPLSAGIYILFSLAVILSCYEILPAVFGQIFREAFQLRSVTGSVAGIVMSGSIRYGLSRGVFSNEAGLGSLAVLHGEAEETTPQKQGMWAMFEVFFDTIVICTMTALVILCITYYTGMPERYDGAALTAWCFSKRLGKLGEALVSGAMVAFAFATIIAWYYLGRQTASYLLEKLFPGKRAAKIGLFGYTLLYLAAVFTGCICRLDIVWMFSDIWNGLMAYPNLFALILLGGQVCYPKKKSKQHQK